MSDVTVDIISSLNSVYNELKQYVNKNINELKNKNNNENNENNDINIPPPKWAISQTCIILQSHPRGISRDVLLTELESRWRKSLKRGEHGGRLSQCVATKELSLTDILEGKLTKIDDFRCNFVSEDASVDMILHRQHTDFLAYMKYYYKNIDQTTFMTNRKCRLTGGRMLLDKSSIILPTPLLAFSLTASLQSDKNFIIDILYPQHNELATVLLDLSLLSYETLSNEIKGADYAADDNCPVLKTSIDKMKEVTTLNDKAIGCFVKLSMISKVFDHPYTNLSVFRYVRLNVISDSLKRPCYIYLILLDDQVNLASLFNLNDTYYIYRPYIASNADESLFKSKEAGHHHVLQYNIVYRDTIALNVLEDGYYPCPCYFLYGATTTIINIDNNGSIPFLTCTHNNNTSESDTIIDTQLKTNLPEILYIHVLMIETSPDPNNVKKNKHTLWGIINSIEVNTICEICINDEQKKKNILKGQLLAFSLSDLCRLSVKTSSVPSKLTTIIPNNHVNEQYTIISGILQGPLENLSRILAFSQSPSIMLPQSFKETLGTFFVLAQPQTLLSSLLRDLTVSVKMKDNNGNIANCLFSTQSKNLSSNCFISDEKIQFTADIEFALLVTYIDNSFLVECISDINEIAMRKRIRE